MQLSKKQNYFSQFSTAFLKSKPNFERYKKRMTLKAYFISDITDCERSA